MFNYPQVNRDELLARLKQHGIDTCPLFYPIHLMPSYQQFAKHGYFPHTSNYLAQHGLSLPSAVTLTLTVDYICKTIQQIITA